MLEKLRSLVGKKIRLQNGKLYTVVEDEFDIYAIRRLSKHMSERVTLVWKNTHSFEYYYDSELKHVNYVNYDIVDVLP